MLRAPARLADLTLEQWDLLIRQAYAANLIGSLALLAPADLPSGPRRHLEWARLRQERQLQAVRFEVARVAEAAHAAGATPVLLKGAAYALGGLDAGQGRSFSDIDVLVPRALLDQVEASFLQHGWATTHHDAYDQRYYRAWMHELPPLMHMLRRTVVDLHHAIVPPTAPVHPDPALLLAAAVPLPDLPGVRMLAPPDLVLHSAVHLFFDGEFDKSLRDLYDLHRLLGQFGREAGFWTALHARARALELTRPLFYALRYTARLFGTAIPAAGVDQARADGPNVLLLALMDALFLRALQPLHPSCAGPWHRPARLALYVRGNWLRMPPLLLARHLFHKAFLSPRAPDVRAGKQ
jgi:hypothetical protein